MCVCVRALVHACVCVWMPVCVRACVCACISACVRVCVCVCVYALRIVSVDKILCFINTLIINTQGS